MGRWREFESHVQYDKRFLKKREFPHLNRKIGKMGTKPKMRTKPYLSPEPCGVSDNQNDPAKPLGQKILLDPQELQPRVGDARRPIYVCIYPVHFTLIGGECCKA